MMVVETCIFIKIALESFICSFISDVIATFVLVLHAFDCADCVLVDVVGATTDVGDKASIHGRSVTNFQGWGVKPLGGVEFCKNAVYIAKLKYFLIKSQFPGSICPIYPPTDCQHK